RTLDQVRSEISAALAEEQRQAALDELTARLDEELADGRGLAEVADELGLEIATTAPITADGRIYGTDGTVPPILERVLEVAFDMEEGSPQRAIVTAGEGYLVFDGSEITPSAIAPLAEIRADVIADWRSAEGAAGARAAADRILERVA